MLHIVRISYTSRQALYNQAITLGTFLPSTTNFVTTNFKNILFVCDDLRAEISTIMSVTSDNVLDCNYSSLRNSRK